MQGTHARCQTCRAMLDLEELFCHNCGTECPENSGETIKDRSTTGTHCFRCNGCGASMSYDASAQALRCPFCGAKDLRSEKTHRTLAPTFVLPMGADRGIAEARLRSFLGSSFWHPSDLGSSAQLHEATPVYVPYWVYEASVHTHFTADSSNTPASARGDWYPVSGERKDRHTGILVSASSVLTTEETRSILPFDLSEAVPPAEVDLENVTVEEFRMPRRAARTVAKRSLEQMEQHACSQMVSGNARNVRANVMIADLSSRPMLLPVWILAYRYRNKVFRVLVNGQSGKLAGEAPTSFWKLFMVIGAIIAVVLGIIGAIAALNS